MYMLLYWCTFILSSVGYIPKRILKMLVYPISLRVYLGCVLSHKRCSLQPNRLHVHAKKLMCTNECYTHDKDMF